MIFTKYLLLSSRVVELNLAKKMKLSLKQTKEVEEEVHYSEKMLMNRVDVKMMYLKTRTMVACVELE